MTRHVARRRCVTLAAAAACLAAPGAMAGEGGPVTPSDRPVRASLKSILERGLPVTVEYHGVGEVAVRLHVRGRMARRLGGRERFEVGATVFGVSGQGRLTVLVRVHRRYVRTLRAARYDVPFVVTISGTPAP